MDGILALLLQRLRLGDRADGEAALQLLREPLAPVNRLDDVRFRRTVIITIVVVFVFVHCVVVQTQTDRGSSCIMWPPHMPSKNVPIDVVGVNVGGK